MSTPGASEKQSQLFVEFRYGAAAAPSYVRYTDWSIDSTFQSQAYTPKMNMGVRGLEISGLLDDKAVEIDLPLAAGTFEDRLTNGSPHSPVFVTIWQQFLATDGSPVTTAVLFRGRLMHAVRNAHGRPNRVMLVALGLKGRMEIPLGLPANHQCNWIFGGRGCGVAVPSEAGTLSVISGKSVTITGLTGRPDRFWNRGYIDRQGISILIRDWLSGTSFELAQEPPADWLNQSVTVFAGCDKTIETCRALWNNEAKFGGIGYAIPNYHPSFESP